MCGTKTKTSDKHVMCGVDHLPKDFDIVRIIVSGLHKDSGLYNPKIYDSG